MKDIEQEVVNVLTESPDTIGFEALQSEEHSPLNQAVVNKEEMAASGKNWNFWKPEGMEKSEDKQNFDAKPSSGTSETSAYSVSTEQGIPADVDAPEQEIGSSNATNQEGAVPGSEETAEPVFELPTETAKQAANTILGMTNNVLAVGGGFFVKIRRHKEFYDFDEVVELIDQQNTKNVERIKLDKDDKALLKPLIVALLKKKAKKLTPEQQLTGAILTILMKKAQVVMEVRAENEILFDRILDIVREEKGYSDLDEEPEDIDHTLFHSDNNEKQQYPENISEGIELDTSGIIETYEEEYPTTEAIVEEVQEESKK